MRGFFAALWMMTKNDKSNYNSRSPMGMTTRKTKNCNGE